MDPEWRSTPSTRSSPRGSRWLGAAFGSADNDHHHDGDDDIDDDGDDDGDGDGDGSGDEGKQMTGCCLRIKPLRHDVEHAGDGDDCAGDDDSNYGVFAGRCYVQAWSEVLRWSDRLNLGYFSSLLRQDVESKTGKSPKI